MSNFPPVSIPSATSFRTPASYNQTVVTPSTTPINQTNLVNQTNPDGVDNQTTLTNNEPVETPFDNVETVQTVEAIETPEFSSEFLTNVHLELIDSAIISYNKVTNTLIPNPPVIIEFFNKLNLYNNGESYLNARELITVVVNKLRLDLGSNHVFANKSIADKLWVAAKMTPLKNRPRKVILVEPILDLSVFEF